MRRALRPVRASRTAHSGYPTTRALLKSAVDDETLTLMSDSAHRPNIAAATDTAAAAGSRGFPEPSEPPEGTWAVLPKDPQLLGHSATDTPSAHHQRQRAMTASTLVIGVVALVLGFIEDAHTAGTIVGLIGVALGFTSQLTSENTNQRWIDIIGTGAAATGLGLSLAHGGIGF